MYKTSTNIRHSNHFNVLTFGKNNTRKRKYQKRFYG